MKHGFFTTLLNSSNSHWNGDDDDDDEVQEEVMTWFKGQAADFYDWGIQKLVPRLNKCLDYGGEYVKKIKLCTGNYFSVSFVN